MKDKVLEACKKFVTDKEIQYEFIEEYNCPFKDISCTKCPFDVYGTDCPKEGELIEDYIQLAQNYIKEHEKTVNTINSIEEQTKETKYKVGDKVRVREDLNGDKYYDKVYVDYTMEKYTGKIMTIESANVKSNGITIYSLKEDSEKYIWSNAMLEPVDEQTTLNDLKDIKEKNIIPTYYHKGNYDVIEFCNKYEISFTTGNIIKYIVRYKNKNGIEDLKKAREYLNRRYVESIEIDEEDKIKFYEENNLSYRQGVIIDAVLENYFDVAEEMIDKLIKYEEKKESDINE